MRQQQMCEKIVFGNQQLVQNKLLRERKQRIGGRVGFGRNVLYVFADFRLVFVEQRLRHV